MSFVSQLLILQATGSESYEFGKMFGQLLLVAFVIGAIVIAIKNNKKPK